MKFRCRGIVKGRREGEAIISRKAVSFLGDVDPVSGKIVAEDSDIWGKSIANKVFIFPSGRGSTVGTYILLKMKKLGTAPAAIINRETEAVIAVGAIIASIPLVDKVEEKFFEVAESGDRIVVDADAEIVELLK